MRQSRSSNPSVPVLSAEPREDVVEQFKSTANGYEHVITFTGERRNDHFEVLVRGIPIELSRRELQLLIDLFVARKNSKTGYLRASPVRIFRIRRAIDAALGTGAGKAMIETGGTNEYRLSPQDDYERNPVAVTASFFELEAVNVVSKSRVTLMRSLCAVVKYK